MSPSKFKDVGYLCLEPLREGRASYTHVWEIINSLHKNGFKVQLYHPNYRSDRNPSLVTRLVQMIKTQTLLILKLKKLQFLYSRWHPCGFITAFFARFLLKVPILQEVNGPYQDFFITWKVPNFMKPLVCYLYRKQLDWADHIIVVTEGLKKFVTHESYNPNVTVITNGANTDLFYKHTTRLPHLPEKYVIYFGAFTPWHGIRTILEATLHPEWPQDTKVVFIGDGTLKDEIVKWSKSSTQVVYLGKVPYEDVPKVVSHAIASFVTIENIQNRADTGLSPLKLYESLACNIPVIITDLPEQSEFVAQNNCGIIICEKDPMAIAQAVSHFSLNPEMAQIMGTNGRTIVESQHSWHKNYERLAAIIKKLCII
ncbi:MAG TPA: glycosyltransferase family 4 protein [Candidatus Nitrosotenuis sp.]|jgi:glycosyltransferase involved in cell wall biosynthesis|nr:glycosyltransferase family 4 protein [Candidatus Nitrosotenuis sp.]